MKVLAVVAAVACLLAPIQCTAVDRNTDDSEKRERTGFLTADWTQKACAEAGGSVDPNKKGNQKCCVYPDSNDWEFDMACVAQTPGRDNWKNFSPASQPC
ncbi:hypothetical protein PHMEG_00026735 [Phytophthora megakarya]|uniref:Uncharacterized protein n=1 Tax=Phytophthora megakarya TaxID=4795 RepID=A0A225V920_9STRA|nr:hypothetical protein PHMEG_00026735 [Phytophthora megakarya]